MVTPQSEFIPQPTELIAATDYNGYLRTLMAVLVEAISVIVRRAAIEQRFAGGWQGFLHQVPNATLCYDDDFACVGFLSSMEVKAYASTLEAGGLVFHKDGQAVDLAVVDQLHGPTVPAPWLSSGTVESPKMKIRACWVPGQYPKEIKCPDSWKYEGSLSDKPEFVDDNACLNRRTPYY